MRHRLASFTMKHAPLPLGMLRAMASHGLEGARDVT